MATRNIVPRATGEGGIGTAAKKWLAGYINNLYPGAIVLGSDADGDLYVRSGGSLTRLPKGSADKHVIMDAAGSLPSYATPFKIGTFDKVLDDAAGDVAYTGVGFKPSQILFISFSAQGQGMGLDNGTISRCAIVAGVGANSDFTAQTVRSIWFSTNYGVNNMRGFLKSFDIDGFTITYDKSATPTGTAIVIYMAFR
jgi:hypothetical protein